MLNELLIVERGARQAGLSMPQLHADVKECGRARTLVVKLDEAGEIVSLHPLPADVKTWTLRDGQQNSFPFAQPKRPLLDLPPDDARRRSATDRRNEGRRIVLLELAEGAKLNREAVDGWPGDGLLNRLRERCAQLQSLTADAGVLRAAIERFLRACEPADGPARLLASIMTHLVAELRQTAQPDWVEVAVALLIGKFDTKKKTWECSGALLFDASGFAPSVVDPQVWVQASRVLSRSRSIRTSDEIRTCDLTGREGPLVSGYFPQPKLPILGQTFIFAKNREIRANSRYRRFASEAIRIGQETAERLAAAIKALTDEKLRDVTWRGIPGEAPKQTDLLLAFVEEAPDIPAAQTLVELDADDDYSEEDADAEQQVAASIAAFEKRTERLVEAVKAKVAGDFRQTPVRLAIFRKLDQANRKVVYAGAPTVAELYDAALAWAAGERNVPPWLILPVLRKGEKKPRPMTPPHIAPLGLIPFSKQVFMRGGTEKQEVLGLPAAEALALFFDASDPPSRSSRQRGQAILRSVLSRRGALVAESAHALRLGFSALKQFDRREALRTVTMLGLLLHKLGRTREVFMNEAAFKLGQLLAAADAVHAGYCADVRGGSVPPSLLGNQVFTMAQTAPAKALAALCRRWKPYDGWAKKAARDRERIDRMVASKAREEKQRGWDIRIALRRAREMRALADELATLLSACTVDDAFRAELLLGYVAGLPKGSDEDGDKSTQTKTTEKEDQA